QNFPARYERNDRSMVTDEPEHKTIGNPEPALYSDGPVHHQPGPGLADGSGCRHEREDAVTDDRSPGCPGADYSQLPPVRPVGGSMLWCGAAAGGLPERQKRQEVPLWQRIWFGPLECIILSVK